VQGSAQKGLTQTSLRIKENKYLVHAYEWGICPTSFCGLSKCLGQNPCQVKCKAMVVVGFEIDQGAKNEPSIS